MIMEEVQQRHRPLLIDSPAERLPSVRAAVDLVLPAYCLRSPRTIAGNASPSPAPALVEAEAASTIPPSQPLEPTHTPSLSTLFGSFASSTRSPSPFPLDIFPTHTRIRLAVPSAPGTPTATRTEPGPDLLYLAASRSATLSARAEPDSPARPGEHLLSPGTIRRINLPTAVLGSPLPVSVSLRPSALYPQLTRVRGQQRHVAVPQPPT